MKDCVAEQIASLPLSRAYLRATIHGRMESAVRPQRHRITCSVYVSLVLASTPSDVP